MMSDLAADLPPPQRLALTYAPARARAATHSVLALDSRLGAILRSRREPLTAQLRLAWWREVLASPVSGWPRGEPLLEALSSWRDSTGLAKLVDGWEALLAEDLTPQIIAEFVAGREAAFASLAAELGVADIAAAEQAARIWALADLATHLSDGAERALVVDYGRSLAPPPLSATLRPLAVLAGLGTRALANGGRPLLHGPGSTLLALRIGMTGR